MLRPGQTAQAQHKMVYDVLAGLMTPVMPPIYKTFMTGEGTPPVTHSLLASTHATLLQVHTPLPPICVYVFPCACSRGSLPRDLRRQAVRPLAVGPLADLICHSDVLRFPRRP